MLLALNEAVGLFFCPRSISKIKMDEAMTYGYVTFVSVLHNTHIDSFSSWQWPKGKCESPKIFRYSIIWLQIILIGYKKVEKNVNFSFYMIIPVSIRAFWSLKS